MNTPLLKQLSSRALGLLFAGVSCVVALPLAAQGDLNIHGALSQGYILSEGNNLLGDSRSGSRDLYELAVNGRHRLRPDLVASGQLTARRAGASDDGRLRVDFAQLDYRPWQTPQGHVGLRLGKVKNAYGLYNDSRDVVFSRPGIRMPTAIYFGDTSLRDLLFSAEGGQLHATRLDQLRTTEFQVSIARPYDATDSFRREFGAAIENGRVEVRDFISARLLQELDAGRTRLAFSYIRADLEFQSDDPSLAALATGIEADIYALSLQRRLEFSVLTAELRYLESTIGTAFGPQRSSGDGGYVELRQLFGDRLEGFVRYEYSVADRNDRSGQDFAALRMMPRHTRFSRHHGVGLQWRPAPSWGLFGEYYYIDGSQDVSPTDNGSRPAERYWQVLLLMAAYRF